MELKRLAKEGWEALFRTLFEHSAEALFVLDSAGRIVELNRQASDSFGLPPRGSHRQVARRVRCLLGPGIPSWFRRTPGLRRNGVVPDDAPAQEWHSVSGRCASGACRAWCAPACAVLRPGSQRARERRGGSPGQRGALPHARATVLRCLLGDRRRAPFHAAGVLAKAGRRARRGVRDRQEALGGALPRAGRGRLARAPGDAGGASSVPRLRAGTPHPRGWQALRVGLRASRSTTGAGASWGIGVSGGTSRSSSAPRRSTGHTSGSWSPWIGINRAMHAGQRSRGDGRARCSRLPSRSSPATGHGSSTPAIRKPQSGAPSWSARGRTCPAAFDLEHGCRHGPRHGGDVRGCEVLRADPCCCCRASLADRFGVRSQMAMALQPKGDAAVPARPAPLFARAHLDRGRTAPVPAKSAAASPMP